MSRVKLDQDLLGLSSIMERLAGVQVKDCFREQEVVYMIVSPGELGKAIGKGGSTVKRVEEQLGKRLRIVEYRDDVTEFVRNLVYPLKVQSIIVQDKIILLQDSNKKTKGLLIGREGRGLSILNRAVKRFFPELEVKVP